jgi:ribonuclease HI
MYFDGCSKGNPGPAGIGAVIYQHADELWGGSQYIGDKKTNNQAEYSALIFGLQHAIDHNIKEMLVYGDSQLVINQMNNVYKVKHPFLIFLYNQARELTTQFNYIEFKHILRNKNQRADELANLAIAEFLLNDMK